MENETAAVTPTSPAPQYVTAKVFYRAIIVVSLAMSILSIVVYDRFFTLKLATFDMLGYANQVRDARAANKLTAEQADQIFDGIRKQIDALPPRYVVISGDAILGNAPRLEKLNIR